MPAVCGVLAMLFLVVPAVEIYLIIKVGSFLGAPATLGIIAVTAIVGAALAKSQGLAVLQRLREGMETGQGVGTALTEGLLVLVAGVTLLAPGFLTDATGLCLLIPPIRRLIASRLAERMTGRAGVAMGQGPIIFDVGAVSPPGEREDEDPPPPGVIDV